MGRSRRKKRTCFKFCLILRKEEANSFTFLDYYIEDSQAAANTS